MIGHMIVGIDPGVKTGVAIWSRETFRAEVEARNAK